MDVPYNLLILHLHIYIYTPCILHVLSKRWTIPSTIVQIPKKSKLNSNDHQQNQHMQTKKPYRAMGINVIMYNLGDSHQQNIERSKD